MDLKLLIFWCGVLLREGVSKDLTLEPGHLKPFGQGGPTKPLTEIDYFPTAREFFENYVKPLQPVKMKGVAKMSPAFERWNDDYFLAQEEPEGSVISVETVKKESRQQRVDNMSFKEFVRIYNHTEHYMVDAVPQFLRQDVMVPCPLQCEQLVDHAFVDNVMWYSSGGTKSVVHTDSVENINCLFRGDKTLVFVDPTLYGDKVDLDRPEGSYSSMDVDSVDYTKFPGMAEVEFYHVNITAGDCLYIPYQWIHQVRSYGSNLAVNIWWKHHLSDDLDYDRCSDPCNPKITLAEANFEGFHDLISDPQEIKGHFMRLIGTSGQISIGKLIKSFVGPEIAILLKDKPDIRQDLNEMFSLLDTNKDAIVTKEEAESLPDEVWSEVGDILLGIQDELEQAFQEAGIDIDENPDVHGSVESTYEPLSDDSDETDLHDEL